MGRGVRCRRPETVDVSAIPTRESMYVVRPASIYNCIRSPSLFYPLTVGVEVVYFHLITFRPTPQSVGLLWTRDRPLAETST
jgi:hypothetical protein